VSGPRAVASGDRVGSRLGGYEIRKRLGSGGMGEVYRARDLRLERDVALKVLPEESAGDPARVRRFEREARAASALTHPNIVTVYEVGSAGSLSFIAMELVEGRTLREFTRHGPLPLKRALDFASQVAAGLAQAHEAGVVHRDLKPENVMISKEGVAKILDFGLAKRMPFEGDASPGETTLTNEGSIVGTVGYMSPEQAAGRPVDFRSDQFSFGSILYEMATGARSFQKKTSVETLSAILNEEPKPVGQLNPEAPLALRWIVERCLAKDPERRYYSTKDLARDLDTLRDRSSESAGIALSPAVPPRRAFALRLAAAVLLLAAALLAGKLLLKQAAPPPPTFRRLTFRRGLVISGRFAPDGQNIVYSAKWGDEPQRVFLSHIGSPESLPLPLPDFTMLLGVSRAGELGLSLRAPPMFFSPDPIGTLGSVPLAGGSPREMLEHVQSADWSPRGDGLAVVHDERLEFPIGKVLYQEGAVGGARFSPKGDRIAILEIRDDHACLSVVDLSGKRTELARLASGSEISNASSMALHTGFSWSPDGEEVWYDQGAGVTQGRFNSIMAVSLAGRSRVLLRSTGQHVVLDVSQDGRLLLSIGDVRSPVLYARAGDPTERDLGWLSMPQTAGVSADGKAVLMNEYGPGGGGAAFLRKTDGSPAFKVMDGAADALSPDASWVAALRDGGALLVPTGAGESRTLSRHDFTYEGVSWFPDGRRLLVMGREKGRESRLYLQNISGGRLTPLSTEGVESGLVSPDGTLVIAAQSGGPWIYSVAGGERRQVPGLSRDEYVASWCQDGRSVFVTVAERLPFRIYRVEVSTGRRQLWKTLPVADPAGVCAADILLLPDGSYAMNVARWINDLYLVDGLR
jgi:Tol biopolymer transport system component